MVEKSFLEQVADGAKAAAGNVVDATQTGVARVALVADGGLEASLIRLGVTDEKQRIALVKEIGRCPNIKAMVDANSAAPPSPARDGLAKALISKWQEDGSSLSKLDKDLASPTNKAKIDAMLKSEPAKLTSLVSKYNGTNMNELLTPTAKPAAPQPAAKPAEKARHPHGSAPSPAKAAEAAAPAAAAPVAPQGDSGLFQKVFESMAEDSDEDIARSINPDFVKSLANGMSKTAIEKFGVEPAIAEGFAKRINGGPNGNPKADTDLVERIEKNLKNNPGFVRQLALASKDNSELPDAAKGEAKRLMTGVMEKPENLADDKEVKSLEFKMKMGAGLSSIGGLLDKFLPAGMGGQIMGWFSAIFEKIKNWFSGFSGKPVLSSGSGGSMSNGPGLFPTVMVHTRNFQENMDNAAAFAKYQPTDMTAYPDKKNGSPFHTEPVLDSKGNQVVKDGKPVSRELPNTISITDAEGKVHKVIPSVGALQAKQEKGLYDANGTWKAGNVHVPVVTGIDKLGNSNKIDRITMTPDQFETYKKDMEQRSGRTYPFAAYGEANARSEPTTSITRVDAKNGAVLGTENVSPVGAQPGVAIAYPVQPQPNIVGRPLDAASNDPEYKLQANKPF